MSCLWKLQLPPLSQDCGWVWWKYFFCDTEVVASLRVTCDSPQYITPAQWRGSLWLNYCSECTMCNTAWGQWHLQGWAYMGIARVFLHIIYHVICLNVLCVHVYHVHRRDVARGHGLWRSPVTPREHRGTKRLQSLVFARVTTSLCRCFCMRAQSLGLITLGFTLCSISLISTVPSYSVSHSTQV